MGFGTVTYSFAFLVAFVTFFNILISILKVIAKQTPAPYIDEIFHVPQAQRYCNFEFTQWNPKITTLPGLYLISIAIIKPLETTLGLSLCSAYGLRFVNVLGTLFNFTICYGIQQKLRKKDDRTSDLVSVMSALNVATFPPLFLFTFLYYTDVWSTAFVLLMYFLHISKSPFSASLSGACAVLVRQTNVLWVGLMVLDAGWAAVAGEKKDRIQSISGMTDIILKNLSWKSIDLVLRATIPYITVCCFFLTFVIVNGGIVVGDRTAHSAVFHPMQNLYFLDTATLFALPFAVFEIKDLIRNRPHFCVLCTLWIAAAVVSEYNLLEHPYLLADNRHLAFYIWRRVFGHRTLRRLLTATYVLSGLIFFRLLRRTQFAFLVWLTLCTFLNLTPQYLFEIRYFIIPFIIARLHFPQSTKPILLETLHFCAINGVVFYIYLTREILWTSEPGAVQRIIW